MALATHEVELTRSQVEVDGRRADYAEGGRGLPVVFLHGWGLGHRAYRGVLRDLAGGCHVYAPSMPGFGGTPDLPAGRRTIEGYAAWVGAFLDAVGLHEPVVLVGHSFGGGVGIRYAHDAAERVRCLVLVNSVGGTNWTPGSDGSVRQVDLPLWRYNLEFARELFCSRGGYRIVQAIHDDLFSNMMRNPWALAEVGVLAAKADLRDELADLGRRELPVMVLWSESDGVVPAASFETLCASLGANGHVVRGGHSWLLANPRTLGQVLENVVRVESVGTPGDEAATAGELTALLRATSMPATTVRRLVSGASPLWLMSEAPGILAGDLALCHPSLADGEVRAVARPLDQPGAYRLTVVAADRPGLFADTAAALAAENVSVMSASAATWTKNGIALHALTFRAPRARPMDWDSLGAGLRSMSTQQRPPSRYMPIGRATVNVSGAGSGRTLVEVRVPDTLGVLEAIAGWFADHGVNIEAARVATRHGIAIDTFLVDGAFEPAALAEHLSWKRPRTRRGLMPLVDALRVDLHRG